MILNRQSLETLARFGFGLIVIVMIAGMLRPALPPGALSPLLAIAGATASVIAAIRREPLVVSPLNRWHEAAGYYACALLVDP